MKKFIPSSFPTGKIYFTRLYDSGGGCYLVNGKLQRKYFIAKNLPEKRFKDSVVNLIRFIIVTVTTVIKDN